MLYVVVLYQFMDGQKYGKGIGEIRGKGVGDIVCHIFFKCTSKEWLDKN
jgi:hypothetical protein